MNIDGPHATHCYQTLCLSRRVCHRIGRCGYEPIEYTAMYRIAATLRGSRTVTELRLEVLTVFAREEGGPMVEVRTDDDHGHELLGWLDPRSRTWTLGADDATVSFSGLGWPEALALDFVAALDRDEVAE